MSMMMVQIENKKQRWLERGEKISKVLTRCNQKVKRASLRYHVFGQQLASRQTITFDLRHHLAKV